MRFTKSDLVIRKIFFLTIILMSFVQSFAQDALIKGKVTGNKNEESLPGVSISYESGKGTITDLNGQFQLNLKPGKYVLSFSFVGFSSVKKSINISKGEIKTLNVQMNEESRMLNTVVVSGSAYEKKVMDEIISIDVIKPYLIQNNNVTDISEAVEKVPGVKITDGQTSIRSGSGYSYGTGSRVQVVVDGQSFLAPDLGDVKWKIVPTDNVEQIEVIKGASSVLYGSSSMNGVINILTAWPGAEPETSIKFYHGIYTYPNRRELAWWDKESSGIYVPSYTGLSLLHKQKFGNTDVVAGANWAQSYSYMKDNTDFRVGGYFKLRYRHPHNKGLTMGISGNLLYEMQNRFMFYQNSDTGGYVPISQTGSQDLTLTMSLNPYITYYAPNGDRHTVRLMYFNVEYIRVKAYSPDRPENTPAQVFILSYQLQKKLRKNMILTSGIDATLGWARNDYLYRGITPVILYGALFSQLEHKIGRVTFLTGLRYEAYGITSFNSKPSPAVYGDSKTTGLVETSKPILRTGLNCQLTRSTSIRFSFGEAYRFPAVSERFLYAEAGGLNIFPNPELKAERGWSLEAGIKQEINISTWKAYADLAIFWNEYNNLINYTFGKYRDTAASSINNYGFKALNISRARIAGFEISILGEGSIYNIPLRIMGGYTFAYPGDLQSDPSQRNTGRFLSNLFKSFGGLDSAGKVGLLTLRNRHIIRFDVEADFKRVTLGVALNYNSPVERIDDYYKLIDIIVPGIKNYLKDYSKGTVVLDAKISYRIKNFAKLTLLAKNLANVEYSDRPGLISAPRSISLQCNIKF